MDILLKNAKAYVERGHFVEAVHIKGEHVHAVGGTDELLQSVDKDVVKIIDCQGRTVIPGLNDSHLHLAMVGEAMAQLNLRGSTSVEEIAERAKEYLKTHEEAKVSGILGRGWDQDQFEDECRPPDRFDLDQVSTDIPIVLYRMCGHMASCNTKAIEMLGLDENSEQMEGGSFEVDAKGYPTGVFTEKAASKLRSTIPSLTIPEYGEALLQAMDYAIEVGLTSVQSNDARSVTGDRNEYMKMVKGLYEEGRAKLRYRHQMCFLSPEDLKETIDSGFLNDMGAGNKLSVGPVKLFKDGSLGGRTGLLSIDYVGMPGYRGISTMTPKVMDEFVKIAEEAGIQVITHVIGDQALEETMDSYKKYMKPGNPNRHAFVHLQLTSNEQLQRIKDENYVVEFQPIFLNTDSHIVEELVGKELASTSYANGTLAKLGIPTGYGTDAPVEDCNPFYCIYCAITRKDLKGRPEGGYRPEEAVDITEAIDAYTIGSAYCEFAENEKGRIKEGYLADLIVLDNDVFTSEPEKIRDTKVLLSIIGGEVVYEAEGFL